MFQSLHRCYAAAAIAVIIRFAAASVAGPVITTNFPDPTIIWVTDSWYVFVTGLTNAIHIPYATSPDFDTWTVQEDSSGTQIDALPNLPSWVYASDPAVWAPDVSLLADGTFIMYFCAAYANSPAQHCVGAATSSTIEGPYTATSDDPLFCPIAQGGAIDASGFLDSSGQRYVAYKVDGNSIGNGGSCGNTVAPIVATPLILQPVAADGVTFDGDAITMLDNNGTADDGIVEAPSLLQTDDGYVLFFSSGCYATTDYTVSYATSTSLTGPWTRVGPLFATGIDGLESPGGADISRDGIHMLFHGTVDNSRELYTALISVSSSLVVTA